MDTEIDPFVCYVLMRTDLPDYLPGKSMAQAHHAGVAKLHKHCMGGADLALETYSKQADGFGTTIVLGVTYPELRARLEEAERFADILFDVVTDPTYPIRDGDRVGHMSVETCGYIFGRKSLAGSIVEDLPLFRDNG